MKRRYSLIALITILSGIMLLIPLQSSLQASVDSRQIDSTQQYQTIQAILAPRLTMTALQNLGQLQTIQAHSSETAVIGLTATSYALTSTSTPTTSPTPSNTFTP